MKNPLQTFEANTKGRDFVIGDLHGSHSVFLNLLENLKFDGEVDRMFSVGDLVDRGPNSLLCLELMKEPWFHCVLSNHEQMMLEAFRGGYMGQFWLQNGGMWGYQELSDRKLGANPNEEFEMLLDIIAELPYLITVDLTNGKKLHIIHAELPPHQKITDADLADEAKLIGLATVQSSDGDYFVWGRFKFYEFYSGDLSNEAKVRRIVSYKKYEENPDLSHIVSGHTILQKPMTIYGQTNIDTGAFASYKGDRNWPALTCIELNTWKFYQATEKEFREVEPLVINTSEPTGELNG
jgi:serine/threonine protein phosphatase 1